MYYIDTSDAVTATAKPTPPTAGSEKFFSDTPGSATVVPAWFLNMLQEELGNVVSGASLSHSKTDNSQLLKAVQALIASKTTGVLLASKNLSDVANTASARSNLGLATVASSGSYSDLSNKPALATVATSGSYADLANKPDLTALSGYAKTTTSAKIEAPQSSYSGDLNTIEVGGVFTAAALGATNAPTGWTQGMLSQFAEVPGWDVAKQFLASPDGTVLKMRVKWGGGSGAAWSAWNTIWSSANDGAESGLDADLLDGLHASQITGAIKKYLVLDQYNGNIIRNSLGISSITDHAVGQYTVSFTTPWPNVYYVPASCTLGDTGNPDCVVIEDEPGLTFWSDTKMRMAHKVSGTGNYVDGRPDTIIFAGM